MKNCQVTLTPGRTGTDVWSDVAHECPSCHLLTYWWRNVNGHSLCVTCAINEEMDDAFV